MASLYNDGQNSVTRVLIADRIHEKAVDALQQEEKLKCYYDPNINSINMKTNLRSFKPTILVVKDTKVTEESIDAWPGLRLVIKYGDSLDNVDVEHCSRQGIIVAKSTR